MARNTHPGPKADKLPLDKMPVERLAEVLPEGSGLATVVKPPHTSVTTGTDADHGSEPWLFDETHSVLMGDFNAGTMNTLLTGVVPLNGDLYVFGIGYFYQYDPFRGGTFPEYDRAYIIRWDAELGEEYRIAIEHGPYIPTVLNGDIYYLGDSRLHVLDGVTDQVSTVNLPAGQILNFKEYAGELIILGSFEGWNEYLFYDPLTSTYSAHSLPDGPAGTYEPVANVFIGGTGSYYYVSGYTESAYGGVPESRLYSINVDTKVSSTVGTNLLLFSTAANLDTSLYFGVYDVANSMGLLLKADDVGSVTTVLTTPYNTAPVLLEQEGTAIWFSLWNDPDALIKLTDGSVIERFQLGDEVEIVTFQILNGTAYVGAKVDGVSGLYQLNEGQEAGVASLQLIWDLGGSTQHALATLNEHLIVFVDDDFDGDGIFWSSPNPSAPDSWVQITPPGVEFEPNMLTISNDYLV